MRNSGEAAQSDVVAAFLRAEVDSPNQVGQLVRRVAREIGLAPEALRGPSRGVDDDRMRREILRRVRGFPDQLLFSDFPADIRWSQGSPTSATFGDAVSAAPASWPFF